MRGRERDSRLEGRREQEAQGTRSPGKGPRTAAASWVNESIHTTSSVSRNENHQEGVGVFRILLIAPEQVWSLERLPLQRLPEVWEVSAAPPAG